MNVNWKKSTIESKEMPEQKFDAAFGISKCFQRSKRTLHVDFIGLQRKNIQLVT
jgi:hypothetical protein